VKAAAGRATARAHAPQVKPDVQRPNPADPTLWPQREALKSALQYPALAGPVFDSLAVESFTHPGYAAARAAIGAARGTAAGLAGGPSARQGGRRRGWRVPSGSRRSAIRRRRPLPRAW